MALIKEINELPFSLKSFIISLVLIMPFWYLSIFIFKKDLIVLNGIQIPIILSFCLSACYFSLNLFTTLIISSDIFKSENQAIELLNTYMLSCTVSVFWLSISIFVGFYYDWKLLSVIKITFLISIIHFFIFVFREIIKNKKN